MAAPDFSEPVKRAIRHRASYICSNPNCRQPTLLPSSENEESYIMDGEVAHIKDARELTIRFDENMSDDDRASISNGIYLCAKCHTEIDKNKGIDYPIRLLEKWKKDHRDWLISVHHERMQGISENLNRYNEISKNTINLKPVENLNSFLISDYSDFINQWEAKNQEYMLKLSGQKSHPNHPEIKKRYWIEASQVINQIFKLRDKYNNELDKLNILLNGYQNIRINKLGKAHINLSRQFCNHYNNHETFNKESYNYIKVNQWRESYKILANEISIEYGELTKIE